MATKHRMFSNRIVQSARFLKMPPSTQALYFHLALNADDDGVVEAHSVMKVTDSKDDDYNLLLAKNFIYQLNSDLVAVILDWREHNLLRPDRKVDSIYQELLLEKLPSFSILKAKPRADTGKLTAGRPMDDKWTAQGKVRQDKVYIASDDAKKIEKPKTPPSEEVPSASFEDFMEAKGHEWKEYHSPDGEATDCWQLNGKPLTEAKVKALAQEYKGPSERRVFKKEIFDYHKEWEKLKNSPHPADWITALVWFRKGYKFDNMAQMKSRFDIDKVYSKKLEGYEKEQIKEAILKAEEQGEKMGFDWKVSTVVKIIAEV